MYAVIMAGGTGTRFWPLSRERFPKQFLKIIGSEPMIHQTITRISPLIPYENIFIVTNPQYAEEIRFQLPFLRDIIERNLIIEPMGRNTAPALGLASIYLKRIDREGIMLALPADHVIKDRNRFLEILERGKSFAEDGYLVTIGIKPTRPETGYGYIKADKRCRVRGRRGGESGTIQRHEAYRVTRFVEKPSLQLARDYLKSGDYFWNSGIFIWKVSIFLEEIKRYMPELCKGLSIIENVIGTEGERETVSDVYSRLASRSVDHGVMEKSKRVVVIPANFDWNDVGSWKAMDDILEKDGDGNIVEGNTINIDSKNSIIFGGERLLATVGIDNIIVVDTEDATLVCAKERAQDVKKVVEELKKRNSEEYKTHRTVYRPWGSYAVLEKGEGFQVKKIVVKPGSRLSLQRHRYRSEHWVVVSGKAKVTVDEKTFLVNKNEETFIPIMAKHRLENPSEAPLQLIEVQCGSYIAEDDIERFEDDYGRVGR